MIDTEQTQLDRIEAKLNDLMAIKSIAVKLFAKKFKIPESMAEHVANLMASRQDLDD